MYRSRKENIASLQIIEKTDGKWIFAKGEIVIFFLKKVTNVSASLNKEMTIQVLDCKIKQGHYQQLPQVLLK